MFHSVDGTTMHQLALNIQIIKMSLKPNFSPDGFNWLKQEWGKREIICEKVALKSEKWWWGVCVFSFFDRIREGNEEITKNSNFVIVK